MKIVVIGTGYVGLVSGVCFADMGHDVVCVDKDAGKIDCLKNGQIPIFEPGLDQIVARNIQTGRLAFSITLSDVLPDSEVVLLAVGTPPDEKTGRADLKYVFAAAEEVARNIKHKAVIVTKSTVPVGTGKKVAKIFADICPQLECEIASNPEFLREGAAIDDFMKPDRIIVGAESDFAKDAMQRLYSKLIGEGHPILFTNIASAETIKYASNAFLAMKIAFANEMADICEGVGADVERVIYGMTMDKRIGGRHMSPGPGYGGSCFPKDTLALTYIAQDAGFPTAIIEAVISSNDERRKRMVKKIVSACGGSVNGKKISVLGLTFKANTDDMRDSPSLVIVPELLAAGADISVYDPEGMHEAKKDLKQPEIKWCDDSYSAIKGADCLVILTEWDEFKQLDIAKVKSLLATPLIVDLRNILDEEQVVAAGIKYFCVGKS
jgi:UDPglucose 6-dehydrogenase